MSVHTGAAQQSHTPQASSRTQHLQLWCKLHISGTALTDQIHLASDQLSVQVCLHSLMQTSPNRLPKHQKRYPGMTDSYSP